MPNERVPHLAEARLVELSKRIGQLSEQDLEHGWLCK